MAVDTSGGPYNGTIYVTWADRRNGSVTSQRLENSDIYFSRHLPEDHDTLWQSPLRVNDDSVDADQWHPWVTVDPDGIVSIVFYDSRLDAANLQSAVFLASSYDGGETFVNYLVSDADFTPCPITGQRGGFMGDYIGITSGRCWAYPCWNDNRSGVHQIYMARVPTNQIWHDSTWTGKVALTRDLIIAPGATLTIDAGTVIDVSPDCDTCSQGADEAKVELVVEGTLIIDVEPNDPVVFGSSGGDVDDWYGIRVVDSGQVVIRNATIRNAVAAISLESPAVASSIDSCVIDSCKVGVKVESGTPAMTIRNVRIEDCAETGLYLADSVPLVGDTVVGTLSAYGAHLLDCRVVIDSSVIPTRGISCNVAYGDMTWDSTSILTQNVTIDTHATLTISPGGRVLAASGHALKVYGNLIAIGTESDSVHFTSKLASPGRQDWAGIRHYGPGNTVLEYAAIADAYRGLWIVNNTNTDTVSVDACAFRHGFLAGIQNDRDAGSLVSVTGTLFEDIQNHGIYSYRGHVEVDGCEFRGNLLRGITIEAGNFRPTAGQIRNCLFESLTAASCVAVYLSMIKNHTADSNVILKENTFGPRWLGSSPNEQAAMQINNCVDTLTLRRNRIDGDSAGEFKPLYGITDYSTTAYIHGAYNQSPSIDCAVNGIFCLGYGSNDNDFAHVSATKIESGQYGVYVYTTGRIDLEHPDSGNAFVGFCESAGTYSVYNLNSGFTIPAKHNYWDSTCATWPDVSDYVSTDSALYEDPFGGGQGKRLASLSPEHASPEAESRPVTYLTDGNYANPFNSSTIIAFTTAEVGKAELVIFNVLGQRVRSLVDGILPSGQHLATWDGKNENGQSVASGVYFYRLLNSGRQVTKKMVVMK